MKKNTTTNQPVVSEENVQATTPVEATVSTSTVAEETIVNPFANLDSSSAASTGTRKFDFTPQLQAISQQRANELVSRTQTDKALADQATKMLQGNTTDLIELINLAYTVKEISDDAAFLKAASADELDGMLESRRSDRSKTKAKGLTKMTTILSYIAAMYAELLIRENTGKPYQSNLTTELFVSDDKEAITKKIKSLQSKQSRLNKLAAYDVSAAAELADVKAEISRLNELRGTARVSTSTTVKSVEVDKLRTALADLDVSSMDEAALKNFENIKQLLAM